MNHNKGIVNKIILGSSSPRRQQLLNALYDNVVIQIREIDEKFPAELKGEKVAEFIA